MEIRKEIDEVIKDLEKQDVYKDSYLDDGNVGLGDVVENTLNKFGITESRFKKWFGLEECNCKKRKKWLNGLFTYHKKKYKK